MSFSPLQRTFSVFGTFLILTICAATWWAQNVALEVNEKACRLNFGEAQVSATLAVKNNTSSLVAANVKLELIDQDNHLRYRSEKIEQLRSGASAITIDLTQVEMKSRDLSDDKIWWRLRYVITFENEAVSTPLQGIISASEITPDIFDLQIFGSDEAQVGTRYQARARASHPITGKPVNGVKINATSEIEIDDKEVIIKASGITNGDGYAVLDFELPKDLGNDNSSIEITFTAKKGILTQEVETDVRLRQNDNFILTTDKPLYQPGQSLHTRILLFDMNQKAKVDTAINFKIEDPENQTIFRSTLKTSKFGVANVDWQIPENTRLGNYSVQVGAETSEESGATTIIKISRYDLPTFVVNTKPNQGYYLPGKNAEVEIKADYLFGQPVAKGKVKVVREGERHWNYKAQKYDVEESEKYEGEIDSSGKFTAKITLDEHHENLKERSYRQFEDVHYAAYFTDATTGRTEQRRFDLRVTKEPIHLYVLYHVDQGKGLPLELFVNASYADGAPAQCEIAVNESIKLGGQEVAVTPITTIKTNQYGVARINDLMLSERQYADNNFSLKFAARDSANNIGQQTTTINWPERPIIRISTDKSLYRTGEAMKVHLNSNLKDGRIIFEILQGGKVSSTQLLDLKQGQANLVLPYKPDYKDEITLIAYTNDLNEEDEESSFVNTSRTVLFPRDRELKLEVKLPRNDYQPGEEVKADLSVRKPDGHIVESVIGAMVVDTAVAERARTDSEFQGSSNRSYYDYYYGRDNLAGFTRRDLDKLDTRQQISEGMDIVAEILLRNSSQGIHRFGRSDYAKDQHEIFAAYFESQFRMMRSWLETEYNGKSIYPKDIATLKRILRPYGFDPEELRDPWGTTYHFGFLPEQDRDKLMLLSAGADKIFDTRDDFVVLDIERLYFKFTGEAINRAIANYQVRTGDYIRDAATVKTELKREGIDFDALRDPWGTAYQISFRKNWNGFQVLVKSAGKDKIFTTGNFYSNDDVEVWSASIDYANEMRHLINQALDNHIKATKLFPATAVKFRELLQKAGIDFDSFHDPLGHKYYATVRTYSEYSSVVENVNYAKFGEKAQNKMEVVPVTQTVITVNIRTVGEDQKEGTADDVEVTRFTRIVAEQSSRNGITEKIEIAGNQVKVLEKKSQGIESPPGFGGTISGVATDASGAAVSSVKIIASNKSTNGAYESVTNAEGFYVLKNLPAGLYDLRFEAQGFKLSISTGVTVISSNITQVNLTLEVGGVSESVTITAEAVAMQTESSEVSKTITSKQILDLPLKARNVTQLLALQPGISKQADISTPRLREYFPETLLWQPNIETDKQGRAQLKFKLADNITTWKLSLIGSTVDGQIGTVEKDIRAFQPFFAELDSPKILTEGDEISLPVVLRNYLDKPQIVDVQFKPESWFTMLSPARKKSEVKANDSTNEIFNFRAIASINKGKQRVTAIASAASDAIEKTVNVHPDGEEIAETSAGVFSETGALEINLPKESIAGSVRGELKIYPNLLAHVTEGIEGILQRPHGCGEQTISSTYPNVMALRLLKNGGIEKHGIEKTALKYTQAGYERLLGYRDTSGGFTYWGKGEPDLALTAYALRFLNDADEVIDVKEDIIEEAEKWLFKQQRNDGHWSVNEYYKSNEDTRRSMMYTALIARAVTSGGAVSKEYSINLERAFVYLEKELKAFNEPYSLANYVIAAQQAGQQARAKWAMEELRKLPQPEAGGNYWALETNTPFYGWGLAGRIETTALVVKALNKEAKQGDETISKGVFWLLRNKDRYGVWLSTQATINVLEAFISLNDSSKNSPESSAEIFVNGSRATSVTMPPGKELVNPITVDLSKFLVKGKNMIEIKCPSNGALASAQLVETYYLPWSASMAAQAENFKVGAKRALRLAVTYDKTEVKIGEEITCKVEAERIGFSGYGMMLAEIGLPPGVDVDRASLESAVKEEGWGINHYDVLPDRVILYLWPRAGGCKFSFKFRSRYGTNALNAASILYDYYNPEARAVIAPTRFVVK